MKTNMNWVWHNLFYLFNSQLNFDAKNSSKALQRRYLRNKSLWWPFQTNHQLLSAIRNRTTYNCKVKHSQVLSGAHCPAAIFNSFTLLITFVESFKYNMVKQSKLHFWSSTDFLTEKGQNSLSQWSCIGGVYFHLCVHYQHQQQVQQRNNPHFSVIQRQNTLLRISYSLKFILLEA